jgi:hypothetical protein
VSDRRWSEAGVLYSKWYVKASTAAPSAQRGPLPRSKKWEHTRKHTKTAYTRVALPARSAFALGSRVWRPPQCRNSFNPPLPFLLYRGVSIIMRLHTALAAVVAQLMFCICAGMTKIHIDNQWNGGAIKHTDVNIKIKVRTSCMWLSCQRPVTRVWFTG